MTLALLLIVTALISIAWTLRIWEALFGNRHTIIAIVLGLVLVTPLLAVFAMKLTGIKGF